MSGPSPRIVVIGAGPAGQAALALLPGAILVARPNVTAWHAEPGRVWVEGAERVWAESFDALLVCANEPLLLAALGCAFVNEHPMIEETGRTSVTGIFAAGSIRGAISTQEAAAQGSAAAQALLSDLGLVLRAADVVPERVSPGWKPQNGTNTAVFRDGGASSRSQRSPTFAENATRLDPTGIADLLARVAGPDRDTMALEQCALLGPIIPARPVSLARLAAFATARPEPLPPQQDDGCLA